MDPFNDNEKKSGSLTAARLALLVISVNILITLLAYPFLKQIPAHVNAAGQVTSYMSKLFIAFLPLLSLVFFFGIRGLVRSGPRLGRENQRTSLTFIDRILAALSLLFLVIQLLILATSFKLAVDAIFVISLFVSVFYVFIGNYMGKLQRNFWVGVRTPWTIASDAVWERTHRLGGWLFVAVGLVSVVSSFIAPLRPWNIVGGAGGILLVSIILCVYSYVIYQHLEVAGKEPLSPPFDRDNQ